MVGDVIQEYLVSLGFKVDKPGFNELNSTINQTSQLVGQATGGWMKAFTKAGAVALTSLAGITTAMAGLAKRAAMSDIRMEGLARSMMVSKDVAWQMKQATDALGESVNDIALNPELLSRYTQLMSEGGTMRVGGDFKETMRGVRDLLFEFKRLKQEVSYAMTWVGYYIVKYLSRPLEEIRQRFSRFNDAFVKNMSNWTERIARGVTYLIDIGKHFVEFLISIGKHAAHIWNGFSSGIKGVIAVIGVAWGLLKMSPIGRLITLFGTLLLLVDDYFSYFEGKDSALGEYWEKLHDGIVWSEEAIISFAQAVEPVMTGVWDTIMEAGRRAKESLSELAVDPRTKESWTSLKNLFTTVGRLIKAFCEWIGRTMEELADSQELIDFIDSMKYLGRAVWDLINGIMQLVNTALSGLLQGFTDSEEPANIFISILRFAARGAQVFADSLGTVLKGLAVLFKYMAKSRIVKEFFDLAARAVRWFGDGFSYVVNMVLSKLGLIGRAIRKLVSGDYSGALKTITGSGDARWNKRVAYETFREAGYSDKAAAGVLGRVQQESGFSTDDVPEHYTEDGLYVGGLGMFQLNGSRKEAFKKWAAENGYSYLDARAQTLYAIKEARESGITPEALANMEPDEIASLWTKDYEVGVPGHERQYARNIYREIKSGDILDAENPNKEGDNAQTYSFSDSDSKYKKEPDSFWKGGSGDTVSADGYDFSKLALDPVTLSGFAAGAAGGWQTANTMNVSGGMNISNNVTVNVASNASPERIGEVTSSAIDSLSRKTDYSTAFSMGVGSPFLT